MIQSELQAGNLTNDSGGGLKCMQPLRIIAPRVRIYFDPERCVGAFGGHPPAPHQPPPNIYIYIYMYVYTYIYIYMYICICVYIYMFRHTGINGYLDL